MDRVRKYAKLMRIEGSGGTGSGGMHQRRNSGGLPVVTESGGDSGVNFLKYNEEEEMKKSVASEYREGNPDGKAEGKAEIVAIIRKRQEEVLIQRR